MRDDNIFKAKLAEQVGRYDDMTRHLVSAFIADGEKKPLSKEEVRLISTAFDATVGKRRSALKYLQGYSEIQRVNNSGTTYADDVNALMDLTAMIRREVTNIGNECVALCQEVLPLVKHEDDQAVLYKLMADNHRYLCEFQKDAHVKKAHEAYDMATNLAKKTLPGNDQVRMGIAQNYAIFQAEVLNDPSLAAFTAQNAIKDYSSCGSATASGSESCRQSAVMAQSLEQNARIWSKN